MTDRLYVQNGKILTVDGALKCGCCGQGEDDWVDDLDPSFPGGGGGGDGGPDPNDPDCCGCDNPPNLTGCTNCWDASTDVDPITSLLDVSKRVRVAARINGSMRVKAVRTDSSGAVIAEYEENYPFDYIIDSYPGDGDEFCGADAFDSDTINGEVVGTETFGGIWAMSVSFSTDNGFDLSFSLEIGNDGSPWSGGARVTHALDIVAQSGSTITDGVEVTAQTTSGQATDSNPMTVSLTGICNSREQQAFSGLLANRRDPSSGNPAIEVETELTNLSVDMVAGNVFSCSEI